MYCTKCTKNNYRMKGQKFCPTCTVEALENQVKQRNTQIADQKHRLGELNKHLQDYRRRAIKAEIDVADLKHRLEEEKKKRSILDRSIRKQITHNRFTLAYVDKMVDKQKKGWCGMTQTTNNLELDYCICETFGITIDEWDNVSLKIVEAVRDLFRKRG